MKKLYFVLVFLNIIRLGHAQCEWKTSTLGYPIRDVAHFDANTAIAVGTGGLLRSPDGGGKWDKIDFDAFGLSKISIASENVGYVIGEYGAVLKTVDKGLTWDELNIKYQKDYIYLSSLFFLDETVGWVLGSNGELYKTTDGGMSWQYTYIGYENYTSVYFRDNKNGFITGNSNTLMKTEDGGKSWTEIDMEEFGFNVGFQNIVFINNVGYIGANSKVLKSVDGGKNWAEKGALNYSYYKVHFLDENNGFAYGEGLYKTTDGGETWIYLYDQIGGRASGMSIKGTSCLLGGANYGNEGSWLSKSIDGGNNWRLVNNLYDSDLQSMQMINSKTAYLSGNDRSTYKTNDGGITWNLAKFYISEIPRQVKFFAEDEVLVIGYDSISYSDNEGATWVKNKNPLGVVNSVFYFDEKKWFASNSLYLFKTINGGQTFDTISTSGYSWDMHFFDENQGVASTGHSILTTGNGGKTWTKRYEFTNYGFKLEFLNNSIGFAFGGNGEMYRTTDGGLTWNQVTTLENTIKCIQFIDVNRGFVAAGRNSIYETTDGGLNWKESGISSAGETINDIAHAGGDTLFFVGENLKILKVVPGFKLEKPSFIRGNFQACTGPSTFNVVNKYLKYEWSISGGEILEDKGNEIIVNLPTAGTYKLSVRASNDCNLNSEARELLVTVVDNTLIPSTITGLDSICPGNSGYSVEPIKNAEFIWTVSDRVADVTVDRNNISVNWKKSGNQEISVKIKNACGTGVSRTMKVFVKGLPEKPTVTMSDGLLRSSSSVDNQWYVNGRPIFGATGQTYTPQKYDGNYFVEIKNDCGSVYSDSLFVKVTSMEDELSSPIKIFPNPASEVLYFGTPRPIMETVEIVNQLGQALKLNLKGSQKDQIHIKNLADGVYFLLIREKSGKIWTKKFIKKSEE